ISRRHCSPRRRPGASRGRSGSVSPLPRRRSALSCCAAPRPRRMRTMPDLLFLHQLDALASAGCADPACQQTHTDGIAWRPPCHPDAGLAVTVELAAQDLAYTAALALACGTCQTALWTIACLDGHVWYAKGDPTCAHDDNDLHVGYA